jgi:hypothetical protein
VTPYVLVSLWAGDDDATRIAHMFACGLHARRAAARFVHGDAPEHDALRAAAEACPGAPVVVFAHGGAALSARRGSEAWIRAEELAAILSGRRVYAFACSTFVPQPPLLFNNFACLAVDACVSVFVGHEAPIMAPFAGEASQELVRQRMEEAIHGLLERFIDGEDDEQELRNVGRMHAASDLPLEIDLPSEDPDREGAFGWSSSAFLGGFFKSLRVETKALAAARDAGAVGGG